MYEQLRLDNQLCFPLYAASKELVRHYKPFLDPLDLTYTQYIAMMVLWEQGQVTVKELGEKLWLDSGTLTPVLKKLEAKGYILRRRDESDERSVVVSVTDAGAALADRASEIPIQVGACLDLSPQEGMELHRLLRKVLAGLGE